MGQLGWTGKKENFGFEVLLLMRTGTVKWFDEAKGFGFIVPDDGSPDVLLHVTCLRRDGFQTAYEGARVVCEAVHRVKGMQAFRVLSMDESTAIHPAQILGQTSCPGNRPALRGGWFRDCTRTRAARRSRSSCT